MTTKKGQQVHQTQLLPIAKIKTNTGQIPGLPKNPRLIRDERFIALKRSITEFPEMLELREIVVFPFKSSYVCIGGNMRLVACRDLGLSDVPAKIFPKNTPIDRLAEFAVKDNVNFGHDDLTLLAAEWSDFPISDWGAEIPDLSSIDLDDFFKDDDTTKDDDASFTIVLNYASEPACEQTKDHLLKHGKTFEAAVDSLLGI